MNAAPALYRRHRFPVEVISHCVWLYFRFALSYRDVEEIMAMRGVVVTYEAIREWCLKFGQIYANELRRKRPQLADKWHLDEVFVNLNGKDHTCGEQLTRMATFWIFWCKVAGTRKPPSGSCGKLLKGLQCVPRVIITDKREELWRGEGFRSCPVPAH